MFHLNFQYSRSYREKTRFVKITKCATLAFVLLVGVFFRRLFRRFDIDDFKLFLQMSDHLANHHFVFDGVKYFGGDIFGAYASRCLNGLEL